MGWRTPSFFPVTLLMAENVLIPKHDSSRNSVKQESEDRCIRLPNIASPVNLLSPSYSLYDRSRAVFGRKPRELLITDQNDTTG